MQSIDSYTLQLNLQEQSICTLLAKIIHDGLPKAESKLWHAHPVWFMEGNPIVG